MLSRINDKRTLRGLAAHPHHVRWAAPTAFPRIGEPEDLKNITAKKPLRALPGPSRNEPRGAVLHGKLIPGSRHKRCCKAALAELPRAEVFVPVGTTPAPQGKARAGEDRAAGRDAGKAESWLFHRHYGKGSALSCACAGGDGLRAAARRASSLRTCAKRCPSAITPARRLKKFKGVLSVSSGVEFSKLETAKTEILRQLEACKAGDITDDELESARGYLVPI